MTATLGWPPDATPCPSFLGSSHHVRAQGADERHTEQPPLRSHRRRPSRPRRPPPARPPGRRHPPTRPDHVPSFPGSASLPSPSCRRVARRGERSPSVMSERPPHWPGSFDEFRSHRTRALDRLAVDSMLREVERPAGDLPTDRGGIAEPLAVDGDLNVLSEERLPGWEAPGSGRCDLAEPVRPPVKASSVSGIAVSLQPGSLSSPPGPVFLEPRSQTTRSPRPRGQRGAAGEEILGSRLDACAGQSVIVLHDLRLLASRPTSTTSS